MQTLQTIIYYLGFTLALLIPLSFTKASEEKTEENIPISLPTKAYSLKHPKSEKIGFHVLLAKLQKIDDKEIIDLVITQYVNKEPQKGKKIIQLLATTPNLISPVNTPYLLQLLPAIYQKMRHFDTQSVAQISFIYHTLFEKIASNPNEKNTPLYISFVDQIAHLLHHKGYGKAFQNHLPFRKMCKAKIEILFHKALWGAFTASSQSHVIRTLKKYIMPEEKYESEWFTLLIDKNEAQAKIGKLSTLYALFGDILLLKKDFFKEGNCQKKALQYNFQKRENIKRIYTKIKMLYENETNNTLYEDNQFFEKGFLVYNILVPAPLTRGQMLKLYQLLSKMDVGLRKDCVTTFFQNHWGSLDDPEELLCSQLNAILFEDALGHRLIKKNRLLAFEEILKRLPVKSRVGFFQQTFRKRLMLNQDDPLRTLCRGGEAINTYYEGICHALSFEMQLLTLEKKIKAETPHQTIQEIEKRFSILDKYLIKQLKKHFDALQIAFSLTNQKSPLHFFVKALGEEREKALKKLTTGCCQEIKSAFKSLDHLVTQKMDHTLATLLKKSPQGSPKELQTFRGDGLEEIKSAKDLLEKQLLQEVREIELESAKKMNPKDIQAILAKGEKKISQILKKNHHQLLHFFTQKIKVTTQMVTQFSLQKIETAFQEVEGAIITAPRFRDAYTSKRAENLIVSGFLRNIPFYITKDLVCLVESYYALGENSKIMNHWIIGSRFSKYLHFSIDHAIKGTPGVRKIAFKYLTKLNVNLYRHYTYTPYEAKKFGRIACELFLPIASGKEGEKRQKEAWDAFIKKGKTSIFLPNLISEFSPDKKHEKALAIAIHHAWGDFMKVQKQKNKNFPKSYALVGFALAKRWAPLFKENPALAYHKNMATLFQDLMQCPSLVTYTFQNFYPIFNHAPRTHCENLHTLLFCSVEKMIAHPAYTNEWKEKMIDSLRYYHLQVERFFQFFCKGLRKTQKKNLNYLYRLLDQFLACQESEDYFALLLDHNRCTTLFLETTEKMQSPPYNISCGKMVAALQEKMIVQTQLKG